jgi:hypothetical protein
MVQNSISLIFFNIRFEREKIEKLNSSKERENHRLTPQKRSPLVLKGFIKVLLGLYLA